MKQSIWDLGKFGIKCKGGNGSDQLSPAQRWRAFSLLRGASSATLSSFQVRPTRSALRRGMQPRAALAGVATRCPTTLHLDLETDLSTASLLKFALLVARTHFITTVYIHYSLLSPLPHPGPPHAGEAPGVHRIQVPLNLRWASGLRPSCLSIT